MSRVALFNSPLLLGFEHFERALDRVNKVSGDGYPPYNVEQIGDNALRITLAVAGFTMADLSITVEDSQLVIRGKQADDDERVYLHRGIAARQFQRSFVLAEGHRGARRLARERAAACRSGAADGRGQGAHGADPRARTRRRRLGAAAPAARADIE